MKLEPTPSIGTDHANQSSHPLLGCAAKVYRSRQELLDHAGVASQNRQALFIEIELPGEPAMDGDCEDEGDGLSAAEPFDHGQDDQDDHGQPAHQHLLPEAGLGFAHDLVRQGRLVQLLQRLLTDVAGGHEAFAVLPLAPELRRRPVGLDVDLDGRHLKVNVHPKLENQEVSEGQLLVLNESLNVVELSDYEIRGEVVRLKDRLD